MAGSTDSVESGAAGRVLRLRENWRIFEDGALAERLQTEEIAAHLGSNRQRNLQIRHDFPKALEEQTQEARLREQQRRIQHQQEEQDMVIASRLQSTTSLLSSDRLQREYEAERDRVFAQRLQRLERTHHSDVSSRSARELQTPPLPVTADGDVPEDVLPHVRGGVRYNDDQYLVKQARPAVVTAEPVYANNRPGHYAVSAQYPRGGNIDSSKDAGGGNLEDGRGGAAAGLLLLGAAGLSQKDLALSKKAEEQLEQERRDAEFAKHLQKDLSVRDNDELAARDFEYAQMLQEKEKAKLRRAKERTRLKRQQLQRRQLSEEITVVNEGLIENDIPTTSPKNDSGNGIKSNETEDKEEEEEEPRYANLDPSGRPLKPNVSRISERLSAAFDDADTPIPPYMPMQQQSSRKSSSMEKRIKKKKEKEGCKQQ